MFQHFPSALSTGIARAGQPLRKSTWRVPCGVLVFLFPEKDLGVRQSPAVMTESHSLRWLAFLLMCMVEI